MGDKMELIVQKAVELGVYKIVPVAMKRCVVRLDDEKAAEKGRALGRDREKCSEAVRKRYCTEGRRLIEIR